MTPEELERTVRELADRQAILDCLMTKPRPLEETTPAAVEQRLGTPLRAS